MGLQAPAKELSCWLGLLVRESLFCCAVYLVWGLSSTYCVMIPYYTSFPCRAQALRFLWPSHARGHSTWHYATCENGRDGSISASAPGQEMQDFELGPWGRAALLRILILLFSSSVTLGNLLTSGPQFSHH